MGFRDWEFFCSEANPGCFVKRFSCPVGGDHFLRAKRYGPENERRERVSARRFKLLPMEKILADLAAALRSVSRSSATKKAAVIPSFTPNACKPSRKGSSNSNNNRPRRSIRSCAISSSAAATAKRSSYYLVSISFARKILSYSVSGGNPATSSHSSPSRRYS